MNNYLDLAAEAFKSCISADSTFSSAHGALGRVYYRQRYLDKAVLELEKSISLNPNEGMSYWVLGEIYKEKGLMQKSEEYKTKALSVVSSFKNPALNDISANSH